MMLPSHLLATALAALALSRVARFGRREWTLALLFGVAVDLDHLLQVGRFAAERGGWSAFLDPATVSQYGAGWQGFLHTPAGAAVAGAAALAARSWAPPVFWGLHMVLDFVVARHFVVFGSPTEWAVVAVLAACLLAWLAAERRTAGARVAFPRYVRDRVAFGALSLLGLAARR